MDSLTIQCSKNLQKLQKQILQKTKRGSGSVAGNIVFNGMSKRMGLVGETAGFHQPKHWTFFDLNKLERELAAIEAFAKPWKNKFPSIVFVGLGGAILGTQAIVEALLPFPKKTKVHFLRNLDSTLIEKIFSWISFRKTLFVVISKSGETIETLALFDLIAQKMYSLKLRPSERIIVITEEKPSTLYQKAKKMNLSIYPHPKNIGGRFSVLTAVSMLPSCLLGLCVKDFFLGAEAIRRNFLTSSRNLSAILAQTNYELLQNGKSIMVLFPYSTRLLGLCNWYIQLLAESLGKKGKGITPLIAVGPKDQHSLLQLFLNGPRDKWFLFFSHGADSTYKKIDTIVEAEKEGVKKAFEKKNIPFMEINIRKLSEKSLGALFFMLETEVALIGKIMGVNAFNQPAVEETKRYTQKILRG